jgi:hypothetical protein
LKTNNVAHAVFLLHLETSSIFQRGIENDVLVLPMLRTFDSESSFTTIL